MSVWEFSAAVDGWLDANTPKKPGSLSQAEADRLWDDVQNWRMQ